MGFADIIDPLGLFESETNTNYYEPRLKRGTGARGARDLLNSLLNRGRNVQFPRLEIPDLTDIEQQGQDTLGDIVAGRAFRDPSTSPLYANLRREYSRLENEGVDALRHRQGLSGTLRSSPGVREEGEFRSRVRGDLGTQLGALFEAESARDNPYTRVQAAQQYGALPRLLELARNQSGFQQQTGQLGFDFGTLSQLANLLIGNEIYTQPTVTQEPSPFSQIAQIAGPALMAAGFSDSRLKENVVAQGYEIAGVPVVSFTWNGLAGQLYGYEGQSTGVIAQEARKVHPDAVIADDAGYLQVNYDLLRERHKAMTAA